MSLSRDASSAVLSPSAYWTTKVTTTGFLLCERAGSTNGTGVINWVALQADKRDITHGSVTFSGIWTTETKCDKVTFSKVSGNAFCQVLKCEENLLLWNVVVTSMLTLYSCNSFTCPGKKY